jgi:RHS repeat-associated protein
MRFPKLTYKAPKYNLRRRLTFITAKRVISQIVCLLLAISLLCDSTPAAIKTIVGVTNECQLEFAFWLQASGTLTTLKRLLAGEYSLHTNRQESQSERDARVRRLYISPGNVTAHIGEVVRFSAIAFGDNGETVGGVKFRWSSDVKEKSAFITSIGEFSALAPGKFRVSVSGAGQTAETVVTIRESPRSPKESRFNVKHFSTRDAAPDSVEAGNAPRKSRSQAEVKTLFQKASFKSGAASSSTSAPAPLPQGSDTYGWNLVNYRTADDPGSQVGDPPGGPTDDGVGNGNFEFSAPVLALPGRGINISLSLTYNAHLWHKANGSITYDIDRGWPSAGWSLGFGRMADIGDGGSILIEADGTRHGFNGTATGPGSNTSFSGHTNDGSFIDYSCVRQNGVITFGSANLNSGTQVLYGAAGDGAVYPTFIIDPNGNFINVTYRNNAGPQIETITDTLGRIINFYYDTNNLLTAITAPGLNGGSPRTVVRLHYQQQSVNASFSGVTPLVRAPSTRWLIDGIYYPATSTGYWFNDTDSFLPSYGMLAKVTGQGGMSYSSSGLTDMGTLTSGTMTSKSVYGWVTSSTDAPTYSTLTESWSHMDTAPAVTSYLINQSSSPRTTTITQPNGVKNIQYAYNAPGQFNDGLVFKDETYDPDGTTLLIRNEVTWQAGDYNSPRPTFTTATTRQQGTTYITTGTEYSYQTSPSFNQVTEVRNYDHGYVSGGSNTLLRKTVTEYENSSSYTNRHIFNLPKKVSVYSGSGARVSETEYTYDGVTLQNTPGVIQHLAESDPYATPITQPGHYITQCTGCPPCSCVPVWIPPTTTNPYKPETDYRGNVTQVKTYADAGTLNQATAVVETRSYDITGNMVKASTSCCDQTTLDFTSATYFAYPEKQTRGSATDALNQLSTSAIYDFNTGLVKSTLDANGRPTLTSYFDSLRPQIVTLPTGAHTDYAYDDGAMTVTESTYLSGHPTDTGLAAQTVKSLNGRGLPWRESMLGAGAVSDFVDTTYDNMGRVSQQSRPYRSGDTKLWSTVTYDALGRTTRATAPDGSVSETYYNEVDFDTVDSYVPARPDAVSQITSGDTKLMRDAWGRERWSRTDAEGRLVEVVEPNPSGNGSTATGGLATSYSYDTLGKLTGITQGGQTRSFKYDSLGRLTSQKLAEANATLDDTGTYVGSGSWSDVFTYDTRSNITSRTDARGVKTVFSYNSDPLNRVQSVSWNTTGFGDTSNPITAAATVSYAYRTKTSGTQTIDITQIASIATAGISTESYSFDSEGRLNVKTVSLNSRSSYPFVTDYIYDELNRVSDIRYPAEYGNGTQPRKVVHHDYDVASRVTGLSVDSQAFASNILYNAASQTTSLNVGVAGPNQIIETYGFAADTGLLSSQKLARYSTPTDYLLDLSYDYTDANGKRTSQITKILNNKNHDKDRSYSYDALGRLGQARGGPSSPLWTQTYTYDRFGNRTSVTASGTTARNDRPVTSAPRDLLALNSSEPAPFLRDDTRSVSDSPSKLRSANAKSARNHATAPYMTGPPTFTDDPLTTSAIMKAIHVTELRDAINSLRLRAGLLSVTWAEAVSAGVAIKASHITEMRTGLEQARTALTLSPTTYTDPSLPAGTVIKAAHIQEIRDSLKVAWSTSSQISRDGHASLSYETSSNHINSAGFGYDAAGNQVRALTAAGSTSQRFQYDAANRLVKVSTDDNSIVLETYTYAHGNQLLIAQDANGRTYYIADDGSTRAEYSESGAATTPLWSKSYVYLGDRLLSTLTPNAGAEAIQYHHPDRLGTRVVSDPGGTSFEQVTLPFGTALKAETTGPGTNRRFTSYDRSAATGLDYAVNRRYDSQQGRFTQVDPIAMDSSTLEHPQTLNLYAYVNNDPINNTDPDGLGIGSFFRAIGRFFTAVGNAISKILNNKWVKIGITIASFLVGVPAIAAFLGRAVVAVINTALHIYDTVSNLASTLQLYGMLLQGKFKEFGKAVGAGLLAAALATIEDSVIQGVKDSVARRRRINLHNLWIGVKQGFSQALRKLSHNFFGRGLGLLIPFYGNYCGPDNGDPKDIQVPVDAVDKLCQPHDQAYQGRSGVTKYEADKTLFQGLLFATAKSHLIDRAVNLAFGTKISGGEIYRELAIPTFGTLIGFRYITGIGK